ncbi:HTH luxR-type domain-containing protein [Sphingomonas antarctica]|uniref:helix-turn-helix domain-containing protein n=1 Tax=Sphingomonas antarctica TaxID=2040274 RepID=UPI0039E733A5
MATNIDALSEKEKQTLRLIVRGHDAKSIARHLDLSVHTINERLRDARRKMEVSSSREAARQLLAEEGAPPYSVGDDEIGEAAAPASVRKLAVPENGAGWTRRPAWIIAGVALMSLILALAAVTSIPQAMLTAADTTQASAGAVVTDAEVEAPARHFLELIDQGRWDDSYKLTAESFHKMNTPQVWAQVSEKVRPPLGAVVSRTMLSHENLPAPPFGYEVVKFRTTFANKANAIETVSLNREAGGWRIAGVTIE